jgi:hypothetical protein
MVICIASIIVFMVACYYIRNVLLLKLRNTFDSREMIKLLEKKEVPPEELCISAAQSLRGYIDENVSAWSELSMEIRRSYRLYYVALFASIVLYIICILP